MALGGTFKDFSILDILQLIGLQRKTGTLEVKSSGGVVTLSFDSGRLVGGYSSLETRETNLGYLMLRSGYITESQLEEAIRIKEKFSRPLGSLLLEKGACSLEELSSSMAIHHKRILFSLFRFEEGEFKFESQNLVDYDSNIIVPLEIEMLLMEAAQMLDEWPIVRKVIQSADMVFRLVQLASKDVTLSRDESAVFELIDGQRSVAEILTSTPLSEFDCSKALFDLVSRGLIEESNKAEQISSNTHRNRSVQDLMEKIKEFAPSYWLEAVDRLPPSVISDAIAIVFSIRMKTSLWPTDSEGVEGVIEPVTQMIEMLNVLFKSRRGAIECAINNIGFAVLWDIESDMALLLGDCLTGQTSLGKFRSQVVRVTGPLMPLKQN